MEIIDMGGTVVSNPDDVLNKWKERFKKLYNDDHDLKWHYAKLRINCMRKLEIGNNCIFCNKCA